MNQERTSRFEPDNKILATTINGGYPFTLELPRNLDRVERACEARIGDLDVGEHASFEHRREPAADGLDLGQLGHAATVPARGRLTT